MSLLDIVNITAQIEGIELIILLIVLAALFLFGPQKIPEMARGFGRALGEFQRGRMEIEREIRNQLATPGADDPRTRIDRVATALGFSSSGRSEMQLKLDIARGIDRASDAQITSAAAILGVGTADANIQTMRERILKALE